MVQLRSVGFSRKLSVHPKIKSCGSCLTGAGEVWLLPQGHGILHFFSVVASLHPLLHNFYFQTRNQNSPSCLKSGIFLAQISKWPLKLRINCKLINTRSQWDVPKTARCIQMNAESSLIISSVRKTEAGGVRSHRSDVTSLLCLSTAWSEFQWVVQ